VFYLFAQTSIPDQPEMQVGTETIYQANRPASPVLTGSSPGLLQVIARTASLGTSRSLRPSWILGRSSTHHRSPWQVLEPSRLLAEILWRQLDWGAVRCAVGGALPGVAVARKLRLVAQALVGDQTLQRGEPMSVIGFPGVGVAASLRA
jgi:hypothetical protein